MEINNKLNTENKHYVDYVLVSKHYVPLPLFTEETTYPVFYILYFAISILARVSLVLFLIVSSLNAVLVVFHWI